RSSKNGQLERYRKKEENGKVDENRPRSPFLMSGAVETDKPEKYLQTMVDGGDPREGTVRQQETCERQQQVHTPPDDDLTFDSQCFYPSAFHTI
ncbi:MAG: hypothetical protein V3U69_03185, partial [Bacteroidota bacterium]